MNIKDWAEDVKLAAMRNVGAFRTVNGRRRRIDSSGKLRNSLGYLVEKGNDGTIIKFTSDFEYAVYVEQGVSGTETKYKTPFSYTTKLPPVGDDSESWGIRGWMKAKPLRLRDPITGQFVPSKRILTRRSRNKQGQTREAGQEGFTDYKQNAAFGIAYNIRKHGVAPTNFMMDAIEERIEGLEEVFTEEIDVLIFERTKK